MRHVACGVLVWLLVAAAGIVPACSQGLVADAESYVRASVSYAGLQRVYRNSSAWRKAYELSGASVCNTRTGSLCASAQLNPEQQGQLLIVASPQMYDTRSAFRRRGIDVLGPVKQQGDCGACVAFAVLGAAQTAAAVALRRSIGPSLSEQDYYFCKTTDPGWVRNCEDGLMMKQGIAAWLQLQRSGQLPVLDDCLPYDITNTSCSPRCQDTLQDLVLGTFSAQQLGSIPLMQQHIRNHGSIICRTQIFTDTRPFFEDNPTGVYRGPGPGARSVTAHAVQVVGYDNQQEAWLVKNSWGDEFADGGFSWFAFNTTSMCDPGDTYGLKFEPLSPPVRPEGQRLSPHPRNPSCYWYTAVEGDYSELVATTFGTSLQQLLLLNVGRLKDPITAPSGTQLLLCNISSAWLRTSSTAAATNASRGASNDSTMMRQQLQALLAIKQAVDATGMQLADWRASVAAAAGGYCNWSGVSCNAAKQVVQIDVGQVHLAGRLPSGAVLQRLPALEHLHLLHTGVGGPLPRDYCALTQLQVISLGNNALTGTLPSCLSQLGRLRQLWLWGNKLTGPLPDSYGQLSSLELLSLYNNNGLTGTLPPTWQGMKRLTKLSLFNTNVTGTLPPQWAKMTAMQDLQLQRQQLTGTLPPSWSGLRQLQRLHLSSNRLTGVLPPEFGQLQALQILDLSRNDLEGTVPSSWGKWAKIQEVGLDNNTQLTGCLPKGWWGKVRRMSVLTGTQLIGTCVAGRPLKR